MIYGEKDKEGKKERVTTRIRNKYNRQLKKFARWADLDPSQSSTRAAFDAYSKGEREYKKSKKT